MESPEFLLELLIGRQTHASYAMFGTGGTGATPTLVLASDIATASS
jgi:hypothetical protein